MQPKQYKLAELTQGLGVTIKGDPNCWITGVCPIQQAQPGQITFLINSLYKKHLPNTQASAVILKEEDAGVCSTNAVISQNPHYIYAKVAAFFAENELPLPGIHATAVIGKDCQIDPTASIGPHVVLGDRVNIAAQVIIGAGCVVGDAVSISTETRLAPRVTVYREVKLGKRVCIASGAVIGKDGFGFAQHQGGWHRIPQLGTVIIGDEVDIGANTTIDRGAVENTVIANGVKLDNQIQIAHNVQIGEGTIIAGCVGIAGSTVIGKHCMIGGAVGIAGHLMIGDRVMITGMSMITKSIREPGIYSTGLGGVVTNQAWRKNNARFHRLKQLTQRVKKLEERK